jgi:hypothetical protein
MVRLFRRLVHLFRPTTLVYCMVCKRTGPTGEPEVVLAWLDRHRCTASTTASRAIESVIKGAPRRWG